MRLLYWTEMFWPTIGGLETYAMQFVQAARKRGYEIQIITRHQFDYLEEQILEDGTTVHRLPFWEVLRDRDPETFFELRQRIETIRHEFSPNLVHVNLSGPSIAFHVETNKRARLPTVVAIHSDLSDSVGFGSLVHRLLDQAARVTTVSNSMLTDLRELFPQIVDKSSFIYNGLATDEARPTPILTNPPNVLCIGRLIDVKGFDVALDCFTRVHQEFPRARLTIAGDGPARSTLEQQTARLGLQDVVTFTGWVRPEGVYDLIGQASVMLIPSRWREPFGLVAVEAALMERPVIASRVGGLKEVVRHGETGFLVEKDDPDALARYLCELLAQPELMRRLGARARAHALDRFGIERNVACYDELYREVLAESSN